MLYKIKQTAREVEIVLRDNEDARRSDKDLLWMYWRHRGLELTPAQIEKFKNMPSPETITRARRKIQEEGRYLPPKAITKERHEQADMFKQEVISWRR